MLLLRNYINSWKRRIIQNLFGSQYRPGHFYSTIPAVEDYFPILPKLLDKSLIDLPGIELNLDKQKKFLQECLPFYSEIPFPNEKENEFRYYFKNLYFTAPDAISLFFILRYFKPKKIIEIGSGFSSAVIMDTNDFFFEGNMEAIFIEPFPDRLNWFLSRSKKQNSYVLHEKKVQDVPDSEFFDLKENDLLFIDSSHVSKLGSDVNHLFFNILPKLKKGVVVHIHDICFPFEYPEKWVYEKRFWNEAYLLRAFLTFNDHYEIILFNGFVSIKNHEWLKENMPILLAEGGSIYLKKIK